MASQSAADVAPLTSMATAMFFGTVVFAAVALAVKSTFAGEWRALWAARQPRSSPLNLRSFTSIYTLLYQGSQFGCILLYAYLCEHHPPFPHGIKSYDRDQFFFLTALLLLVSAFTLKSNDPALEHGTADPSTRGTVATGSSDTRPHSAKIAQSNDDTEVLNRDQTEEWKGWMQFMFLLYHYYHAEEVYNAIRIMITCYVFMTGTYC
jgi:10 TM Acyl Transferase domain found in Cas1p